MAEINKELKDSIGSVFIQNIFNIFKATGLLAYPREMVEILLGCIHTTIMITLANLKDYDASHFSRKKAEILKMIETLKKEVEKI